MKLITSDGHKGLGAARRAVFGSVPWQRCQFHAQQNAGAYVPKQAMCAEVAVDTPALVAGASVRAMFNAPDRKAAELFLQEAIQKYALSAQRLSAWMEKNLAEGFTVFDFPLEHRRMTPALAAGASVRTANSLERINKEIRRRTRVVGVFSNGASCLRLVSALFMEISEEWQIGKRYCAGNSLNC